MSDEIDYGHETNIPLMKKQKDKTLKILQTEIDKTKSGQYDDKFKEQSTSEIREAFISDEKKEGYTKEQFQFALEIKKDFDYERSYPGGFFAGYTAAQEKSKEEIEELAMYRKTNIPDLLARIKELEQQKELMKHEIEARGRDLTAVEKQIENIKKDEKCFREEDIQNKLIMHNQQARIKALEVLIIRVKNEDINNYVKNGCFALSEDIRSSMQRKLDNKE